MASANGHPAHRIRTVRRAAEQIEGLRDRAIIGRLSQSFAADLDDAL